MKAALFTGLLLALIGPEVSAQPAPVPVEGLAGHRYFAYQHILYQNLGEKSPLRFFNVTAFDANYRDPRRDGFMIQALVLYQLMDGLNAGLGSRYNVTGFAPVASVQYLKGGKGYLLILSPTVDLKRHPVYGGLALLEVSPRIRAGLRLYGRVQCLSEWNREGHGRSYQQVRLGGYVGGYQLGVGTTFDQFGPRPRLLHNTGVFIRRELP